MGKLTLARFGQAQYGISLVELAIAASFVLMAAAIAAPHYTRSRIAANEASAVASLRVIYQAETSYQEAYPKVGFPLTITSLGGGKGCKPSAQTACLISNSIALGSDRGFNFAAKGETPINGANTTFAAGAAPAKYSSTGTHLFCAMQDGKVRWDNNLAQSTNPPDSNLCPQLPIL
jgi:type IV pilus assembly protein PilA